MGFFILIIVLSQAIIEDLDRRQEALQSCRDEVARALELESPETAEDCKSPMLLPLFEP